MGRPLPETGRSSNTESNVFPWGPKQKPNDRHFVPAPRGLVKNSGGVFPFSHLGRRTHLYYHSPIFQPEPIPFRGRVRGWQHPLTLKFL